MTKTNDTKDKNGKLTLDELKIFCDYDGEKYVSKSGNEYIKALGEVFSLINKNDKPFTIEEVKRQPLISEFNFSGLQDYRFICNLKAIPMIIDKKAKKIRRNEKIIFYDFPSKEEEKIFKSSFGVSYILTCLLDDKEYIIKIGSSRKTFKYRLQSYNCGCVYNWRTASTTNIKILQSMVTTRAIFKLYIYDCSNDAYIINWHGETSVPFASPKALAVEDIMVKQFIKQFGKKPLANVQVDAEG